MKVNKQKLQMRMKVVYGIWPCIPWGTFSAGNLVIFLLLGRSFHINSCLWCIIKSDWTDMRWNVYDVYSGSNDHTLSSGAETILLRLYMTIGIIMHIHKVRILIVEKQLIMCPVTRAWTKVFVQGFFIWCLVGSCVHSTDFEKICTLIFLSNLVCWNTGILTSGAGCTLAFDMSSGLWIIGIRKCKWISGSWAQHPRCPCWRWACMWWGCDSWCAHDIVIGSSWCQ